MDEIFDKNVKIVFDTSFWIDIYRNLPTTIDTIINALKNDNFYLFCINLNLCGKCEIVLYNNFDPFCCV